MEPYDPTLEALIGEMVEVLKADAETPSYIDHLRALQVALFEVLNTGGEEPEEPSPDDEQVMRQALGRLDPKNTDAELDYGDVLRRLLAAVDRELFKWDSALVQPPGPSGEAQTALTDKSPIPEALRPA